MKLTFLFFSKKLSWFSFNLDNWYFLFSDVLIWEDDDYFTYI